MVIEHEKDITYTNILTKYDKNPIETTPFVDWTASVDTAIAAAVPIVRQAYNKPHQQ